METVAIEPQVPGQRLPEATVEEIVRAIAEAFRPLQIVVFGSYARGHPTPESDLDLLVVMDTDLPRHRRAVPLRLLFRPAPCSMDILVYTPEEVERWKGTVNHVVTEAYACGRIAYERPRH
ncbi:MAG: nucleotidyltransferase domain-containing protein [Deferrisomatales bacterium]